jgi:hypothetical protein
MPKENGILSQVNQHPEKKHIQSFQKEKRI